MPPDPPPASPRTRRRPSDAPQFNPVLWWSTIGGMAAVIVLGSVFVTLNYRKLSREQAADPRPFFLSKLIDLQATNRDGSAVSLSQLEGKVWVAAYQHTGSAAGCLEQAAAMKDLHRRHGGRGDFHLVSISLDPAADTPEKRDAWVKAHGIDAPNWWFLAGEEERIRAYMIRYFKFVGVRENTDPAVIATEGRFRHDLRLALVDGRANVRGYYDVTNPRTGAADRERLERDIAYLLRENDAARPAP